MCYRCYKCGMEVDRLPTTTETYDFWGSRFTEVETTTDCKCGGEFEEYDDECEDGDEDDEFI